MYDQVEPRFQALEKFVSGGPYGLVQLAEELKKLTLQDNGAQQILVDLRKAAAKLSDEEYNKIHWTGRYYGLTSYMMLCPVSVDDNPEHAFCQRYALVADTAVEPAVIKVDAFQNLDPNGTVKKGMLSRHAPGMEPKPGHTEVEPAQQTRAQYSQILEIIERAPYTTLQLVMTLASAMAPGPKTLTANELSVKLNAMANMPANVFGDLLWDMQLRQDKDELLVYPIDNAKNVLYDFGFGFEIVKPTDGSICRIGHLFRRCGISAPLSKEDKWIEEQMKKFGILNEMIGPDRSAMSAIMVQEYLAKAGWAGAAFQHILIDRGVTLGYQIQMQFRAELRGTNVLKILGSFPGQGIIIEVDFLLENTVERIKVVDVVPEPYRGYLRDTWAQHGEPAQRTLFSVPRLGLYEVPQDNAQLRSTKKMHPDLLQIRFHRYEDIEWVMERLVDLGCKQEHELGSLNTILSTPNEKIDHYQLRIEGHFVSRKHDMDAMLTVTGFLRQSQFQRPGWSVTGSMFEYTLHLTN
jgi:hypothetical protein